MSFYALSKEDRAKKVQFIRQQLHDDLKASSHHGILAYFTDEDTYIRKTAYLQLGRLYFENVIARNQIVEVLNKLMLEADFKVRQTVINTAGEIGKQEFQIVYSFFDAGLFDVHHSVRNAVIGSIKKMGEVNPQPVLTWAEQYLLHDDKEIRREICHGIELRGRRYPGDILPLLKKLEFDASTRVRKTLIHVIGQISYKKGCLETVVAHLKTWKNAELVDAALIEIVDVHRRYQDFATRTPDQAQEYIKKNS